MNFFPLSPLTLNPFPPPGLLSQLVDDGVGLFTGAQQTIGTDVNSEVRRQMRPQGSVEEHEGKNPQSGE